MIFWDMQWILWCDRGQNHFHENSNVPLVWTNRWRQTINIVNVTAEISRNSLFTCVCVWVCACVRAYVYLVVLVSYSILYGQTWYHSNKWMNKNDKTECPCDWSSLQVCTLQENAFLILTFCTVFSDCFILLDILHTHFVCKRICLAPIIEDIIHLTLFWKTNSSRSPWETYSRITP